MPHTLIFTKEVNLEETYIYEIWQRKIDALLREQPGFLSLGITGSKSNEGFKTIMITFDTRDSADGWLANPKRAELLEEAVEYHRLVADAEFTIDVCSWGMCPPNAAPQPPKWQSSLLVLSAIYPTANFNAIFVMPLLQRLPLHSAVHGLLLSCITVSMMTWLVMPLAVKVAARYLFPKQHAARRVLSLSLYASWLALVMAMISCAKRLLTA
eukprot:CAMPEP_0197658640 /NCGR_PEP_ID=MMETSP1338-20131121/45355_1 /TAXON_ID=43686 ORGANISM="Pelagodinium beii, Strain RCC1491" /NCGR_SAMPLE_ID=MMETSP1338 /ASSEMBLY_ACC=CAM_ASM_000754 /LENGTH=211 /DNA_ID=CAMNT_0043235261 /DNA_START=257 /DNA_END=892 /DNA_ORIENTATION=+